MARLNILSKVLSWMCQGHWGVGYRVCFFIKDKLANPRWEMVKSNNQ